MRLAVACALAALAVAGGAGGAGAQEEGPAPGPPPTMALTGLEAVLSPEDELVVEVTIANHRSGVAEDLRLVATLYSPVNGRVDLDRALADPGERDVWEAADVELDPLGEGLVRVAELRVPAADLDLDDDPDRFGVYPLDIQLLEGDEAVAGVTTALVFAPQRVEEPVRLATLVGFDEPPGVLPDASVRPGYPATFAPGARLDVLVRELLDARPELTVALSGLLLEQAADLADGFESGGRLVPADSRDARHAAAFLDRVRELAEDAEVVAQPYGPADLVALVRGGLRSEATRLLAAGEETVERHTGVRPAPGVLVPPDGLDVATLSEAQASGAEIVVLGAGYLARVSALTEGTPSPVRTLGGGSGGPVVALVPDPHLSEVLARPADDGIVAHAQRVVAETAVVFFERPDAPQRRGLLLATPAGFDPEPGLLAAALEGLEAAPWVADVPLTDLVGGVLRAPDAVQLAYPAQSLASELPSGYVASLGQARAALAPMAAVLATDPEDSLDLSDGLSIAAAVHYRPAALAAEGQARIGGVLDDLSSLSQAVEVLETPPITLTDDVGQVPVILVNHGAVPVRVQVRLQSSAFEFEPAVIEDLELDPEVARTITFTARANALGGLRNVGVVVEDPSGTRRLASAELAVRTASSSVVALALTGSAGVFLLVWWAREIVRTRRSRRATGARHAA